MGSVAHWLRHDYAAAKASFTKALELNPKLAVSRAYLGLYHACLSRNDEALRDADAAVALEPDSAVVTYLAGGVTYWARDYERALRYTQQSLEYESEAAFPHWVRALLFCDLGRMDEAIATAESGAAVGQRQPLLLATLGYVYGKSGRTADGEAVLQELLTRSQTEYIAPCWVADVLVGLNRHDEAIDALNRGIDDGNAFLVRIGAAAEYDSIRSHPRFPALLERLKLPVPGGSR